MRKLKLLNVPWHTHGSRSDRRQRKLLSWDLFSSGDVLPVNLTVLLKRSRIFYLDFPPWSASCKLIFLHRNTWRCLPECKPQEFTPSTLQTEEQPLVRQGISWKAHSDSLRTLKAEMVHSMDAKWKWQGPETQQIGIMEKVLTWFLDVFSFSLEFFLTIIYLIFWWYLLSLNIRT